MTKDKIFPLNLAKPTTELKELIAQHPDYPIVVLAEESAVCDEFTYTYCSNISFGIGHILDCETPYNNEFVITDEDDLKEHIADSWCNEDKYSDLSDEDFYKLVDEKAKEYELYWKDVVIICVGN